MATPNTPHIYFYLIDKNRKAQSLAQQSFKDCKAYKDMLDPCDSFKLAVSASSAPYVQFGQIVPSIFSAI